MTPSWPQLAGWLAAPEVGTLRCAWREDAQQGRAVYDAGLDLLQVTDAEGRLLPHGGPESLLRAREFERGDDYHRAIGGVTGVVHDGRACWQVQLAPPAHKSGLLTLVVDDATGLCVQMRNDHHGMLVELTELEVDVALPPEAFDAARAAQAVQDRDRRLYDIVRRRPPPTPRWFPWRRGYLEEPGCWVVESDEGEGFVSRAPLGDEPPLGWWEPEEVVRLDHGGWSWAVGSRPLMDPTTARRVVEQVVDGRPYD